MPTPRAHVVPVTPFQQNCTLFFDAENATGVVIDPGGDIDAVATGLKKAEVTVERIILTHGHIDHAGGAMELKERLGVEIVGPHIADKEIMDSLEVQAARFNMSGAVRNCTPDRWLEEGDKIAMAGFEFDVYHCPGHSPGSVAFVCPDLEFAIIGDVIFKGSVGRTDLPGGNRDQLIASIKEKLLPLGDDISFICGHGPGSTFGEERQSNPYLV